MTRELMLANHQSTELAEYRPRAGLIKRGLNDAPRARIPRANILRVPTDYTTLQQAVDFASEGDTIEVLPGEYEENVIITKSLNIGAPYGLVHFRAQNETEPIFLIDSMHGRLSIESIAFEGPSGASLGPRTAVRIVNGQLVLTSCRFARWQMDGACQVIVVEGESSALEARDCQFADSDSGVCVWGAKAIIRGCSFVHVSLSIVVCDGSIVSKQNSVVEGDEFLYMLDDANVDSQYDSLIHLRWLLTGPISSGSIVNFGHATVCSHSLLGIEVGWEFAHPDPDGEWVFVAPKVLITDSIVYLNSTEHLSVAFSYSAPPEWDISQLDAWDYVEFGGRNLVHALPDFPGDDPKFGDIVLGQLSLKMDSPAIGTASDGTNLGSWQGKVE